MTTTTRQPRLDELVERTRPLLPGSAEALRRMPRTTLDDFPAAGFEPIQRRASPVPI